MIRRLVGIALISSSLLAGCATTTTTQTCVGPICGEPQTTTTQGWPDSSSSSQSSHDSADYTGAVIAVSALVTAVALTAVLIHKSHDTDDEKPVQHAKMTDAELRLERMYAQAHLSARAGRCEAVTAIGKKLSVDDPAEYARYSSDHELAVCLPSLQTAALR